MAISSAARDMDLETAPPPKWDFSWREVAQIIVFMISLSAIVIAMVGGSSPAYSGFIGVAFAVVLGFALRPGLLTNLQSGIIFIRSAGIISAQLIVIVGAVGIIIGILNLTGVGLRFASLVASYADGQLAISLILMALACLLLGMGMPTVPAYLIIVLVMGPALQRLGVPIIHTHMFVLYFGVLSAVTPPVALAAFAAAPIAGAGAMRTAVEASRLALPGFVIPFAFIYQPAMLLGTGYGLLASAQSILFVTLAVLLISRACYPAKGKARYAPIGLALALALLFFGQTVSWIAVAVTIGLLFKSRFGNFMTPKTL
jgi:TRAP-type uncharacterized transport system fused permease subunit